MVTTIPSFGRSDRFATQMSARFDALHSRNGWGFAAGGDGGGPPATFERSPAGPTGDIALAWERIVIYGIVI